MDTLVDLPFAYPHWYFGVGAVFGFLFTRTSVFGKEVARMVKSDPTFAGFMTFMLVFIWPMLAVFLAGIATIWLLCRFFHAMDSYKSSKVMRWACRVRDVAIWIFFLPFQLLGQLLLIGLQRKEDEEDQCQNGK